MQSLSLPHQPVVFCLIALERGRYLWWLDCHLAMLKFFLSNPVQILVPLSKSFNSHQNGHVVSWQRLYGNKNISGSHLMPANLRWLESQCIRKSILDSVKQASFLYWCSTCLNLEKVLKFFDLISFQKGVLLWS